MPTTATTMKEGHKYTVGEHTVWYQSKPGEGRRIRFFIRSPDITVIHHIDRPPSSVENEETPNEG